MNVDNALQPAGERLTQFFGDGAPDGPFVMVNLLKFKPQAEYADGRDTKLTGREAYALYGAEVSKLIAALGGRSIYGGAVHDLMIGEVEELWDMVALVEYPNAKAFADMVQSSDYQAAHVHREAGLAGQLNIRTLALNA